MFNIGCAGDANFVSDDGLYTPILRSGDVTKPNIGAPRPGGALGTIGDAFLGVAASDRPLDLAEDFR